MKVFLVVVFVVFVASIGVLLLDRQIPKVIVALWEMLR